MNTFGKKYRFTSFGESHGPAIGGVIDGCPSGMTIDMNRVNNMLYRRAHAFGGSTRAADEPDEVVWLSGIFEGVTLGTPIAFYIANKEARPEDYADLKDVYRPGHADYTYQAKYGIRDYRGGGRASARETASRVVAGAIALQILEQKGVHVSATLIQVGGSTDSFETVIDEARRDGDSVGGIVACTITGMPAGIGEPIFDKLQARLAYAMLSINACKGFEYGVGFDSVHHRGSEINHLTGGIAGGISDGKDITFSVVFKPTPSIAKEVHGRHDACIAARAVPVVEAMTGLALIDYFL